MEMDFTGKVALITGAGNGIGRATALAFAKSGAKIVVVDRDADGGEATAGIIRQQGGEAMFVQADVTKAADVRAYVKKAIDAYGRIDCFFNNAGVEGEWKHTADYDEAMFDQVIGVNVKGVFLGLRHVLPEMLRRKSGAIVNTASVAGKAGGRGYSAYCASKAGILLLTQCMALDFAADKIRVNAVCPGPTATAMVLGRTNTPDRERARWANELPAGRIGEPEDTASVVAYLASDEASFVTGAAWVVDGGRLLTGIGQSTVARP
jgi:NAD(P)-dependent dehydrogenase (short-subunit alcohol dehydrogenase family)